MRVHASASAVDLGRTPCTWEPELGALGRVAPPGAPFHRRHESCDDSTGSHGPADPPPSSINATSPSRGCSTRSCARTSRSSSPARAARAAPVARFVEREVRAYLACGVLAHGFLRLHCDACGHDRLLAFSCKGRGFCPSCGGSCRIPCDTAVRGMPASRAGCCAPLCDRSLQTFAAAPASITACGEATAERLRSSSGSRPSLARLAHSALCALADRHSTSPLTSTAS
jgi:hypothetical protein